MKQIYVTISKKFYYDYDDEKLPYRPGVYFQEFARDFNFKGLPLEECVANLNGKLAVNDATAEAEETTTRVDLFVHYPSETKENAYDRVVKIDGWAVFSFRHRLCHT